MKRNHIAEAAPASLADGRSTTCWYVYNSWGSHVATITAIPDKEYNGAGYTVTYRRDGAPTNHFHTDDYRSPQAAMAAARDSVASAD